MGQLTRRPGMWRALLPAGSVLAVVAAVALATGATSAPASSAVKPAPAAMAQPVVPPYPYEIASRIGPWGFPTRHSTDYVAWRLFERDVEFNSTMRGPNGKAGLFGDAKTWAANAVRIGFKVESAAAAGSIAQWDAGEGGAGVSGHVAYVERVKSDGSVVVSEFDWTVPHGYTQRGQEGTPPVRAPRYIRVSP